MEFLKNKPEIMYPFFFGAVLLAMLCLCSVVLLSGQGDAYAETLKERAQKQFLRGYVSYNKGDYREAITSWEEALNSYHAASDPEGEKNTLSKIALCYYHLGNYDQVILYNRRALEIFRRNNLKKGEGAISNNLGLAYRATGDYSMALLFHREALKVDRGNGETNGEIADLVNIGLVFYYLGNYDQALLHYRKALEISQGITDKKIERDIFTNVGLVYYYQGHYHEGLAYLKMALEADKSHGDKVEAVSDLCNIGIVYNAIGDQSKALENLQDALRAAGGDNMKIAEVAVLTNIGFVYKDIGRNTEAIDSFDAALKICSELNIPETKWRACYGKALILEKAYNYTDALFFLKQAVDIIESIRGKLGEEGDRITFVENKAFVYEAIVSLLVKMHSKSPFERYDYQSFQYVERAKNRAFLDILEARAFKGRGEGDKTVFERDKGYQQEILLLKKKIEALTRQGANVPQGELDGVKEFLFRKESEYESFIKEVKLRNSELASLISVSPAPVEKIQSWLDKDTTLLEYYTTKDKIYAWLISKDGLKVYEIALSDKELGKMVNDFLLPNISNRSRRPAPMIILPLDDDYKKEATQEDKESNREKFYKVSRELYTLIFSPLAKDIKTDKLIIVPHGVLHKVPFTALNDGSSFMADKYVISVLPASSVIEYIVKKRNPDKKRLLAFANPETDYLPLGFAEVEVDGISGFFPKKEVYAREKATEGIVKSKASWADVIHFACHGEFNDRQPLQSGLLLTKDSENDGYLQVHEIFGMDLANANLVTLSACETALSKIQGGDDLVGLSRGFIYAGTPSLLATLWEVDDASTAKLMELFYKNWQGGMTKPEALRQAQVTLKAMPQYKHPFYWAPFVMIGDWR